MQKLHAKLLPFKTHLQFMDAQHTNQMAFMNDTYKIRETLVLWPMAFVQTAPWRMEPLN
jgi:hypothetical protein